MNTHYGTEELADHDVGLLDAGRERQVSEHLSTCPECSDRLAALQQVSLLLAAQPTPAMPEDVFARLHRAVGSLASGELTKADLPSGRPPLQLDRDPYPVENYAEQAPVAEDPVDAGLRQPSEYRGSVTGPEQNPGWLRPTMGSLEKKLGRRRKPTKVLFAALATCGLAAAVGFGGFVLSSVSGHNEPVADHPFVVNGGQLGSATELQNRSGLSPHRFSDAWNCARRVTSGRITGIRASVVNGRSGFLVFLAGAGDSTRVVFVSNCGIAPSAGPSAVLPKN